jgi:hypothetical protein
MAIDSHIYDFKLSCPILVKIDLSSLFWFEIDSKQLAKKHRPRFRQFLNQDLLVE